MLKLLNPINLGVKMKSEVLSIVVKQFMQVESKFTSLQLSQQEDGFLIDGMVYFRASYNGLEEIMDGYEISIKITNNYPNELPVTKEIGGRIPKRFHTFQDQTLCLGAPLALRLAMATDDHLLGYIEKLIIPFLYSFSYREKFGKLPYGELAHGAKGIMDYYQELFKTSELYMAMGLLQILGSNNYRGHLLCPCRSGLRLRNCHGEHLKYLWQIQQSILYKQDYEYCKSSLIKH
jgi:hypothetical protein